ncbi:hypothetical protein [Archangium sp.]|uniref:hypothetical protein n=1 Tax=Archangium sp. TaxID=1872627 RepID=UPI002D5D0244|nr:hypothetical protein [Archangium sp.]HYO56237.1 hypothetical protein [Archangium sp.]
MPKTFKDKIDAIRRSGLSIYDPLVTRPNLIFSDLELRDALRAGLVGRDLNGLPLRTRSKVIKTAVCEAMGYPAPTSFKKTQPRFPGQDLDTYVQKSNNLQIWNEEITPTRRYALIQLDDHCKVVEVRVATGTLIAQLDRTGTLTHKYQAARITPGGPSTLVSPTDTAKVLANPRYRSRELLPIATLYAKLQTLVGTDVEDPGSDQDRNRGSELHRRVSATVGVSAYKDNGRFPDIVEQLLEVKFQTCETVDLGVLRPDDTAVLSTLPPFAAEDARYAVFYAHPVGAGRVRIDAVVVSTGMTFFQHFRLFGGKVKNSKLQIPLPRDFFDAE